MNIENELCQKVYAHHGVLKNEITTTLLEVLRKHNLSRDAIAEIVQHTNAAVDVGSNKLVTDFQRTFKNAK